MDAVADIDLSIARLSAHIENRPDMTARELPGRPTWDDVAGLRMTTDAVTWTEGDARLEVYGTRHTSMFVGVRAFKDGGRRYGYHSAYSPNSFETAIGLALLKCRTAAEHEAARSEAEAAEIARQKAVLHEREQLFAKARRAKHVLVQFNNNYGDEFDTQGFRLMSGKDFAALIDKAETVRQGWDEYFGSNEFVTFQDGADYAATLSVSILTKSQAQFIEQTFGTDYGITFDLPPERTEDDG